MWAPTPVGVQLEKWLNSEVARLLTRTGIDCLVCYSTASGLLSNTVGEAPSELRYSYVCNVT